MVPEPHRLFLAPQITQLSRQEADEDKPLSEGTMQGLDNCDSDGEAGDDGREDSHQGSALLDAARNCLFNLPVPRPPEDAKSWLGSTSAKSLEVDRSVGEWTTVFS